MPHLKSWPVLLPCQVSAAPECWNSTSPPASLRMVRSMWPAVAAAGRLGGEGGAERLVGGHAARAVGLHEVLGLGRRGRGQQEDRGGRRQTEPRFKGPKRTSSHA